MLPKLHIFTSANDVVLIPVHNTIRAGMVYKALLLTALNQLTEVVLAAGATSYEQEADSLIEHFWFQTLVPGLSVSIGTTDGGSEISVVALPIGLQSDEGLYFQAFDITIPTLDDQTIYFTFTGGVYSDVVTKIYLR